MDPIGIEAKLEIVSEENSKSQVVIKEDKSIIASQIELVGKIDNLEETLKVELILDNKEKIIIHADINHNEVIEKSMDKEPNEVEEIKNFESFDKNETVGLVESKEESTIDTEQAASELKSEEETKAKGIVNEVKTEEIMNEIAKEKIVQEFLKESDLVVDNLITEELIQDPFMGSNTECVEEKLGLNAINADLPPQTLVNADDLIPQADYLNSDENLPPPPQILFREPSSSDPEAPESTHNYFQHLGSLRLQMNDWGSEHTSSYIYDDSPLDQEGLSRINKEIKALTRALPCEPSGAVFVSIDSSNLSRLKVLISGTEETPYEHGLYLFDIKLDSNYPNSPPKMTIKTTGNGSLRFNPNLYDSGYVCLSIINTWGGDPEEMWNPSYSTLMQVFLSIQALVMNNDVIQKEPGYEHMETDCPENQDYAGVVKYGNISYAMIEMLKHPPEEFKEIVIKHFTLKKEKIIKTVEKWVEESSSMGNGYSDYILSSHNATAISVLRDRGAQTVFKELFEELKIELGKLPDL